MEIKIDKPLPDDFKILDEHIRMLKKRISDETESIRPLVDGLTFEKILLIIDYYEELRMYERASISRKTFKVADFLASLEAQKQ